MNEVSNFKLNDGHTIPAVGFGVFLNTKGNLCEENVMQALSLGYRSIDTAVIYRNERAVGRALAASGLAREELFVTTKVWPSAFGVSKTLHSVEQSLERLQLDHLDLVLLHRPHGKVKDAWRALEHAQKMGLVKSIGVSNFLQEDLEKLTTHAGILPAVNQLELHPYWQQKTLRDYMATQGILAEAWYPLGHGSKELLSEPLILSIAERINKTPAQVILRWHVQSNIRPLPKSTHEKRIAENLAVFDFELTEEDMAALSSLEKSKPLGEPRWLSTIVSRFPTPPQLP